MSTLLRTHTDQALSSAVPLYDWIDEFRLAVGAEPHSAPALSAVAQRMGMSTRTLQRRLEAQGTTWTAELEAVRRTKILQMLRTTDMPLDSVACRSGYNDTRAMRRAIRRWTGHTTTTLRHEAAAHRERKVRVQLLLGPARPATSTTTGTVLKPLPPDGKGLLATRVRRRGRPGPAREAWRGVE